MADNMFTQEKAGLPVWGWAGLAVAGGVVVLTWLRSRKSTVTPSTDTSSTQLSDAQGLATDQYETLLSLLRDLQGQNSTPIGDTTPTPVPDPTPVPVPNPAPTPSPTPTPTGTSYRYVTVTKYPSSHGTLFGIAKDVYGNGNLWPRLYAANRSGTTRADGTPGMVANPSVVQPGWRILVP